MKKTLWLLCAVAFNLLAVLLPVEPKEWTVNFTCCSLPLSLYLNRSNENFITIGDKSLVIVTETDFDADFPFTRHSNSTVTLDKCTDFDLMITRINENGFAEDDVIHYRSQQCSIKPSDPQGIPGVAVVAVLVVVMVVVIASVFLCVKTSCCKKNSRNTNGVV